MRTRQMWYDHSSLILTWLGMHGTTYKEQPHLCSICTARQSSKAEKNKVFTGGEFPSCFLFLPLSVALICTSTLQFSTFTFGWVVESSIRVFSAENKTVNINWAVKSNPKWSQDIFKMHSVSRCDLPLSISARFSQSPDISDALIPCLNLVTVTISVFMCV